MQHEFHEETDQEREQRLMDAGDSSLMENMEMRDDVIRTIATSILSTRSEAVEYRAASGVERWWYLTDQLLDYASDIPASSTMMDYASGEAPLPENGPRRSRVVMNITRGRCEVAIGRFEDILLPIRGRNWGLKVTPKPEVLGMKGDKRYASSPQGPVMFPDGRPATMQDVGRELQARSEKAMQGMEREIDDQLTEADFLSEERKVIESAVNYGTGILKGPAVSRKLRRVWKPEQDQEGNTVHQLDFQEDFKPVSKALSVWNVYPSPDCEGDVQKCSYVWEKDTMRPKDVQRLIGLPGYDERQLEMVLKEQPKRLNVATDRRGSVFKVMMQNANMGEMYEVWEYNGEVKPEYMNMLGCQCASELPVSGRIVFINDHPVKASLNILDTGDLPYDFFPWSVIDGQPWGAGEPLKVMWAQRIINAAWRQMMDNAGDSSGVNLAIMGLEPEDGIWEATGKKLWRHDGETALDDIRKGITQFQATNNQAELQNILELALRFVDLITAQPTIFQGEAKEAPDTLGATNIIVDSSNVTQRSRAKRFDDMITVPHLRRYYDWNMQYNPDSSIKEDLDVVPLGASVLFEKDQMRMALAQVFSLKGDPDVARKTDWDKVIEQFYASSHLDILKDEDEEQQAPQGQQAPPEQQAQAQAGQMQMQVAQIRTQADLQKAQLNQQADMEELKFKAEQARLDREHEKEIKQMDLQMKMLEYSEKKNIKLSELKVQLAISAEGMKQRDRQQANTPQVTKPPTEPIGQAPAGEAFEK